MANDYHKIYLQLKEKYTDEEIADFAMIPADSTTEEAQKAREEFVEWRLKRRESLSEQDKMLSALLAIKYQIKRYIDRIDFEPSNSLGKFLKRYIQAVGRKQKKFAEDIQIHPSRLSRILKGKEKIGKKIAYRLEQHSGNTIPALFWWKLAQKEIEQEILTEKEVREAEHKKVKFVVYRVV